MKFIALSNITEDGLQKIFDLELDGLPSPSIQIKPFNNDIESITDQDTLFSFGEISFLFNQKNIFGSHKTIPKNNATYEIFSGDGYTLRFPDVHWTIQKKELNNLVKGLHELYELEPLKDFPYDKFDYILNYAKDKYYAIDNLKDNRTFKLSFINDYNKLNDLKIYYKTLTISGFVQNDKELKDLLTNISFNEIKNNKEKYIQFIQTKLDNETDEIKKSSWEVLLDNDDKIDPFNLLKIYKNDIELIQKIKPFKIVDMEKTLKSINKLVKSIEKENNTTFLSYLKGSLFPIFNNPKIRDNNKPISMENVISYMKRNRGAGNEQSNFTGINRATARNQIKIRSLEDLYENKHLISTSEEKSKIDQKRFLIYINLLSKLDVKDDEAFIDMISYLGCYPSIDKTITMLNKYNLKHTAELANEVREFAILNNNAKHLYFEAKINKPFYFKHWKGLSDEQLKYVIIPDNIDADLLKKLEKTDLIIVKYKLGDMQSRLKAIKKCSDVLLDTNISNKQKLSFK